MPLDRQAEHFLRNSIRPFAIVAHREAGRRRAMATAHAVHDLLRQQGARSQLYSTSSHDDLETLVRQALRENNFDGEHPPCIVACGGDGVIQGMVNSVLSEVPGDAVVGLAPAGTCNDFAFALGVTSDPEQIVEVLLHGVARPIDLGMAGDRYFCSIATVGFESSLNRYLRDHASRSPSRCLFVAAAIAVLLTHRPIRTRVMIDGDMAEWDVLSLLIANTRCYGGHIPIAPTADPYDGYFQIGVCQAMSRFRRLALLPAALSGRHLRNRGVTVRRAVHVTVSTSPPREVWADGELIGRTPIDFRVIPGAVSILVPDRDSPFPPASWAGT
jgi:diacylglycerol kinase (ATP)